MSNLSISDITGSHFREGRVFGVEIEIEGDGLPQREVELEFDPEDEYAEPCENDTTPDMKMWDIHEEGSIKGAEYVLRRPLPLTESCDAVNWLYAELHDKYNAEIYESPRTSVHVHINASDWPLAKLRKALPLLAAAEPFLVEMSGRHRKGNLFCLSRLEAPFGWSPVINLAEGGAYCRGDTHYSGINFSPLWNKGSIEFRMMRGLTNPYDVIKWLMTLDALVNAIDLLPDDYDYSVFPDILSFLTATIAPSAVSRLQRAGLRSAREVLEDLTLAAIKIELPKKPAMVTPISLNAYSTMMNYDISLFPPPAPSYPTTALSDEELLAAITVVPISPSF